MDLSFGQCCGCGRFSTGSGYDFSNHPDPTLTKFFYTKKLVLKHFPTQYRSGPYPTKTRAGSDRTLIRNTSFGAEQFCLLKICNIVLTKQNIFKINDRKIW
jgi:hypothetical protein